MEDGQIWSNIRVIGVLEVANPTNKQDEAKHMTRENISGKGEKKHESVAWKFSVFRKHLLQNALTEHRLVTALKWNDKEIVKWLARKVLYVHWEKKSDFFITTVNAKDNGIMFTMS